MPLIDQSMLHPVIGTPDAQGLAVYNDSGSDIAKDTIVHLTGAVDAVVPTIAAGVDGASLWVAAAQNIPAGARGRVLPYVVLGGVDTSGSAAEAPIYASGDGVPALSPQDGNAKVVGQVLRAHATRGVVMLDPSSGAPAPPAPPGMRVQVVTDIPVGKIVCVPGATAPEEPPVAVYLDVTKNVGGGVNRVPGAPLFVVTAEGGEGYRYVEPFAVVEGDTAGMQPGDTVYLVADGGWSEFPAPLQIPVGIVLEAADPGRLLLNPGGKGAQQQFEPFVQSLDLDKSDLTLTWASGGGEGTEHLRGQILVVAGGDEGAGVHALTFPDPYNDSDTLARGPLYIHNVDDERTISLIDPNGGGPGTPAPFGEIAPSESGIVWADEVRWTMLQFGSGGGGSDSPQYADLGPISLVAGGTSSAVWLAPEDCTITRLSWATLNVAASTSGTVTADAFDLSSSPTSICAGPVNLESGFAGWGDHAVLAGPVNLAYGTPIELRVTSDNGDATGGPWFVQIEWVPWDGAEED